jgi:hypothetical protein
LKNQSFSRAILKFNKENYVPLAASPVSIPAAAGPGTGSSELAASSNLRQTFVKTSSPAAGTDFVPTAAGPVFVPAAAGPGPGSSELASSSKLRQTLFQKTRDVGSSSDSDAEPDLFSVTRFFLRFNLTLNHPFFRSMKDQGKESRGKSKRIRNKLDTETSKVKTLRFLHVSTYGLTKIKENKSKALKTVQSQRPESTRTRKRDIDFDNVIDRGEETVDEQPPLKIQKTGMIKRYLCSRSTGKLQPYTLFSPSISLLSFRSSFYERVAELCLHRAVFITDFDGEPCTHSRKHAYKDIGNLWPKTNLCIFKFFKWFTGPAGSCLGRP